MPLFGSFSRPNTTLQTVTGQVTQENTVQEESEDL